MRPDTRGALEAELETLNARPEGAQADPGRLEARLARVEQAYAELLQRVRWYERERTELKHRLERILTRMGTSGRT